MNISERKFLVDDKEIRVIEVNGEPWMAAKDVCEVLGEVKEEILPLYGGEEK